MKKLSNNQKTILIRFIENDQYEDAYNIIALWKGKLKQLKMATVIFDQSEEDIAEIVANDNGFKPMFVGTKDSRRMSRYKDSPAFNGRYDFKFVKAQKDIIPACEKIIADNGYKAVMTRN